MTEHEQALHRHPELVERIRSAQADRSHAVKSSARRPRPDGHPASAAR